MDKILRTKQRAEVMRKVALKHGLHSHPLYAVSIMMRQRCYNEKCKKFKDYGARGIKIYNEWLNHETFIKWALSNGWQEGLQIDRINNDGNYEPSNCRFVTQKVNLNNTRRNVLLKYNNQTKSIAQWANEFSISTNVIYARLRHGWSLEKSLNTQIRKIRKQP